MQVEAVKSFVDGKFGRHSKGDVFEMPKEADWLNAGLVVPYEGDDIETAAIQPPQVAVIKKTNARKPRTKKG